MTLLWRPSRSSGGNGFFARFAGAGGGHLHVRRCRHRTVQHDGARHLSAGDISPHAQLFVAVLASSRSIALTKLKGPRQSWAALLRPMIVALEAPRCEVHLRFKPWKLSRGSSELTYLFFAGPKSGCQAASFRLGCAAITLAFSFFGFLASRLLRCCPLATMSISCWGSSSSSSSDCRTRPRGVQTRTSM